MSVRFSKKILAAALCSACLPISAEGQPEGRLPAVKVVDSSEKTPLSAVGRQEIERTAADNLKDLFRYQTGVSVGTSVQRRGNAGVSIRGIDDNRIGMNVDGEELPDGLTWGHEKHTYGRDFLETDTLAQVDIEKNPAALAANPAALGGAVNFRTYRPQDFVSDDKPYYFSLKPSFRSADGSTAATLTAAGKTGALSSMLMYSLRNGSESKNAGNVDAYGAARTRPNPQNFNQYNLLGKFSFGNETDRVDLTLEDFHRRLKTDVLTSVTASPNSVTHAMNARDTVDRQRFSLSYTRDDLPWILDRFAFKMYRQNLHWRDNSDAVKTTKYTEQIRNRFRQNITGVQADLSGSLKEDWGNQLFNVGIYYRHKQTSRPEDRYMMMGGVMQQSKGYPKKSIPDSTLQDWGIRLSDRINIGTFSLTPALHYHSESIRTDVDDIYLKNNPKWVPSYHNYSITPSLALAYHFGEMAEVYASYARGKRNPPFDSMAGLSHPPRPPFTSMLFIPNPDLKSETSDNFTAGVRMHTDSVRLNAEVFSNHYRNFINRWGKVIIAKPPTMILMTGNADRLHTYGAEISVLWKITSAWQSHAALSWMRGEEKNDGKTVPYSGEQPPKMVLGLGYHQEKWGTNLDWTLVAKQKRVVSDKAFKTPGYGTLDVSAYWKPSKNLDFHVGVYNLTNKKYFDAADIASFNNGNVPVTDLYTRPKRNFSAGMTLKF